MKKILLIFLALFPYILAAQTADDSLGLAIAPGLTPVLAVLGSAALSTALAYLIYFRLLASAGATRLALVTFLIPVSATLLGIGLLGETLRFEHLAGFALIAAGLAAIDGRLLGRQRAGP